MILQEDFMKNVILSADVDLMVYSVPDEVSSNLEGYCLDFIKWLNSPHGKQYCLEEYKDETICCLPNDFIVWLNKHKFPDQPSFFVENLGNIYLKDVPEHCKKYKDFNF